MSVTTVPRPADTDHGHAAAVHFACLCDPAVAVCGADVSDFEFTDSYQPEEACPLCLLVMEANEGRCARCTP